MARERSVAELPADTAGAHGRPRVGPRTTIHPDLTTLIALAMADERRATASIEVRFSERKAVVGRDTMRRRLRSLCDHIMPLRWGCSAET